jgi:hypothetical protein
MQHRNYGLYVASPSVEPCRRGERTTDRLYGGAAAASTSGRERDRLRYGFAWRPIHHASAYLWLLATGVHVVNYARRAPSLAAADWRDHLRGAVARRSVSVGALILGVVLAIAMLPYPSPFHLGAGG